MNISMSDNGRTINLSIGDKLDVSLEEGAGSGFQWKLVSNGSPVMRLTDNQFIAPGSSAAGASGHRVWTLLAESPGKATISAVSRRSWEIVASGTVFSIQVNVT